ncbi:unnamed protein product [Staurois parvus]|uniref:Uncharacterized protein n=1 Tax=Staurois parvus TaxID=386267 RepID=A0ABN9C112_9NEOB|nr:unnamed protein product [Staurois parvus]
MGPPGNRGSSGPCVLAHTQKSLYKRRNLSAKAHILPVSNIHHTSPLTSVAVLQGKGNNQGRTNNSWGPRAIGDHGGPCVLAQTQKSL